MVPLLETLGAKGVVRVNGKTIEKNSCVVLTGGDEVVFSSSGRHAYVSFFSFPVAEFCKFMLFSRENFRN